MRWGEVRWVLGVAAFLVASCGGRSALNVDDGGVQPDTASEELCDGLDNDNDTRVDETYRDELGRYVTSLHCGACNQPCLDPIANALTVGCGLVDEVPACVATSCGDGFGPTLSGGCALLNAHLCLPCLQDNECGDLVARTCSPIANEQRCTVTCEDGLCPADYRCDESSFTCVPNGGSCSCEPGASFDLACVLTNPEGGQCTGIARCDNGSFSECTIEESCDEADNDCDGEVDETFRNARGAYSVDVHNCGACGIDCEASERPGVELICGGDPLSPSCVLDCPDLRDGLMPGDKVDGDRVIGNGCECTFTSFVDAPGPVLAEGEVLDVNCDGADGDVLNSFYVAPDGNDNGPGSPTKPLHTIQAAIDKAVATLTTRAPRRDIFIAAGSYVEELRVPDGVRIHGGYRRDFLALDPQGFQVVWIAPADTQATGGAAAVIAEGAGATETVVEWVHLRGLDAVTDQGIAVGLWIEAPGGPNLRVRELSVRSGLPGDGQDGRSGTTGARPTTEAQSGQVQRGATEDSGRECIPGATNTVRGGNGGANTCGGVNVQGGNGGSPTCPESFNLGTQPGGTAGTAPSGVTAGLGGDGGNNLMGPIDGNCPGNVCCGLADFSVPTEFRFPQAGRNGGNGGNGDNGNGCIDNLGRFMVRTWRGGAATNGTAGRAGGGGGGGGGGGTARIDWVDGLCQFVDGLGGGGGGGGAGGCGGQPGTAGTSGGPAIGIVIEGSADNIELRNVTIETTRGGRGGDGGVGGEGALGGVGAFGGSVPREQQSTPTLAGPVPGARGGRGGDGGAGGGAGGGCGGASVGVWVLGSASDAAVQSLRTNNTLTLGEGGRGGRGGGGAVPAAAGLDGGVIDVRVR